MLEPTRVDMSDALRAYLADWLAWTERGAPMNEQFSRLFGLCYNAFQTTHSVYDELCDIFGEDYPFGEHDYYRRNEARTQHLDPNRLAWVRANLPNPE